MKIIPLIVTILSATILTGCESGSRRDVNSTPLPTAQKLATEAERRGDWISAAGHWRTVLAETPDDRATRLALVRTLRMSNSCGAAAMHLSAMQAETPDDVAVLLELGKCHLISGRLDAARATLESAVKIEPNSWESETVLATALDYLERPKDALKHHDRAIALAPSRSIPLSNKALSLALSGDLRKALTTMRDAAAKSDATSRIRLNLAMLEAISGNGDLAQMMARNEIESDDTESAAILQKIADAANKAKRRK